jgi:hypothetical protein
MAPNNSRELFRGNGCLSKNEIHPFHRWHSPLGHFFRRDLRIKIASGKGTSIRYNPDDIVRKKKHYRTPFLKFAPKFKRIAASLIWEEE